MGDNHLDRVLPFLKKSTKRGASSSILILKMRRFGFALINLIIGVVRLDLETIFSYVFAPFGFLMGLDAENILQEGRLLGQKLTLNEFVAFGNLGTFIESLDPRFAMIASISIAGFANVSSMGICVGGIGVLCPDKRGTLSRLVLRAMLGGMLVSILSASTSKNKFLVHHCINSRVISTCYPCHLHAFEPRCSPLHRRFVDAQLTRISSTITSRLTQ